MNDRHRKERTNRTAANVKLRAGRQPSALSPSRPSGGCRGPDAPLAFSGWVLWITLALIAVNVIVYAPVWRFDFVTVDDPIYVSNNPHVAGGLTRGGVSWAFTTFHAGYWIPLIWLSHMLDVQLYGMNAGLHHVTNVLLHIVNTILLFGLLYRVTGALGRSAFVAALFAVHPLHVESVVWVTERKDVLSTLFWMLTLWAYIRYAREPRWDRYLMMLLFVALGLMAKPMLVMLPFVLLLLDVWPLRRVELGGAARGPKGSASHPNQLSIWLRLVREKLPLLALAAASSVLTYLAQQRTGAVSEPGALPFTVRLENALESYIAYIGKMLWPTQLSVFYTYPGVVPRMVGGRGYPGSACRIDRGDPGHSASPVSFRRMVLVSGNAGAGHGLDSSRTPGNGGSLCLRAAHWDFHRVGLGSPGLSGAGVLPAHHDSSRGSFNTRGMYDHRTRPGPVLEE